jgi:hypothetical protein
MMRTKFTKIEISLYTRLLRNVAKSRYDAHSKMPETKYSLVRFWGTLGIICIYFYPEADTRLPDYTMSFYELFHSAASIYNVECLMNDDEWGRIWMGTVVI